MSPPPLKISPAPGLVPGIFAIPVQVVGQPDGSGVVHMQLGLQNRLVDVSSHVAPISNVIGVYVK